MSTNWPVNERKEERKKEAMTRPRYGERDGLQGDHSQRQGYQWGSRVNVNLSWAIWGEGGGKSQEGRGGTKKGLVTKMSGLYREGQLREGHPNPCAGKVQNRRWGMLAIPCDRNELRDAERSGQPGLLWYGSHLSRVGDLISSFLTKAQQSDNKNPPNFAGGTHFFEHADQHCSN